MARTHRSTTQIARAIGAHPNTVRVYEAWGFLPPVPRSPSGYRLYTERHLNQMRLTRTALHGGWPGKTIRESAVTLVRRAASGDVDGTLDLAQRHLAQVKAELARAENAARPELHGHPGAAGRLPHHLRAARTLPGTQPGCPGGDGGRGLERPPRSFRPGDACRPGDPLCAPAGFRRPGLLEPRLLFTWLFDSLFQMARYPVGVYPGWLLLVLTWVIPVGLMTTVPAQALTGALAPAMLLGSVLFAAALLIAASLLFRAGLRRYASASS